MSIFPNPTIAFPFVNVDDRGVLTRLRLVESITGQTETVYLRDYATTRINDFKQSEAVAVDVLALEHDPVTGDPLGWGRRTGEILQAKEKSNWANDAGGSVVFFYQIAGEKYVAVYEVLLATDELMQWQQFVSPIATVEYCAYFPIVLSDAQITRLIGATRQLTEFPEITWNQNEPSPALTRDSAPNPPEITWNQNEPSPALTRN